MWRSSDAIVRAVERRVVLRQHAGQIRVVLLDRAHRLVDGLAEVGALREVEQVLEAGLVGEVDDALGVVVGRPDACAAPTPSPRSRRGRRSNLASAKRRKIRPRTGVPYSDALSPEFARSSSAASQRRVLEFREVRHHGHDSKEECPPGSSRRCAAASIDSTAIEATSGPVVGVQETDRATPRPGSVEPRTRFSLRYYAVIYPHCCNAR